LPRLVDGRKIKVWKQHDGPRRPGESDVPDTFKDGAIVAFGFSQDGKLLAIGGTGAQPAIWDVATGKQLRALKVIATSPTTRPSATTGSCSDRGAHPLGLEDGAGLRVRCR